MRQDGREANPMHVACLSSLGVNPMCVACVGSLGVRM